MACYCKTCGYVFGEDEHPRAVKKRKCPICKNTIFNTQPYYNYGSRIEKSMPTWEDVVRNKHLKNVVFDSYYANIRKEKEAQKYKQKMDALKPNSIQSANTIVVTCPYCQSTNTSKITYGSKLANAFFLGVFSISKNSKEWHCNNCRSEW